MEFMEIEGFGSIFNTITMAKELYDIDRYDIVKENFSETLSWDSYYENMFGVISSIFPEFHNDYDDGNEEEFLIFSGGTISRYFEIAWEYGRSHNVGHNENPYVAEAESESHRWLTSCHSIGWKLLGYSKTKKTAHQSKLIVYIGTCCECDCHFNVAYGMVQLYKFFTEKCAEFDKRMMALAENRDRREAMAA